MKHQSYIRSLFVAFCAFFVCASAMAGDLNPFAFKVSSRLKGDVFNVVYYLNAPATSVKVTITLPNEQTVVYNCTDSLNTSGTSRVKGIYKLKISLREYINNIPDFRGKTDLPWSVDVMGGNPAAYPTEGERKNGANLTVIPAKEYAIHRPYSVEIDNDPYSNNFGMVYMLDAGKPLSTDKRTYFGGSAASYADGLYVFDAAFQFMPTDKDDYDYNNPITSTTGTYSINARSSDNDGVSAYDDSGNKHLFHKVRISHDANHDTRLFVTYCSKTGPILTEGKTNRFSYITTTSSWFKQIIASEGSSGKTRDGVTYNLYNGSTFVAGPNIAFDVYDNGRAADLELLMLSRKYTASNNRFDYRGDKYKLGNWTWGNVWYNAPTTTGVLNKNNTLDGDNTWYNNSSNGGTSAVGFVNSHTGVNVEYDQDGGFWLCYYRANHSEMPSLVHFNKNGDVNFIEYWAARVNGSVRYDNNNSRLAVSGGKFTTKWTDDSRSKFKVPTKTINSKTHYGHPATTEEAVTIYTVNRANLTTKLIDNNKETSTNNRQKMFIDSVYINGLPANPNDIAWDFADNMYFAFGGSAQFMAYALPHAGKTVATPCKTDYYFNTPTQTLTVKVTPSLSCGNVVDKSCPNMQPNELNGNVFKYYYLSDAADGNNDDSTKVMYQLKATPNSGYRFVNWGRIDDNDGKSTHENITGNFAVSSYPDRVANFGINVWETATITPINEETTFRGVFVQRELDTESYSTICLPFNLETLVGTPYEGASVLEFTSEETSNVDGDNRISLNFTEVTFGAGKGMRAGKPYLIQVKNAISGEKIFWDVTCPDIDNQGKSVININGTVTFHALLNPTTFTAAQLKDMLFLTADNRLVTLYGQNSVNINGLRGYFTVSGDLAKTAEFVLNLPEKVTTSIPMVNMADSLQVTKYLWDGKIYIQRGNEVYDLSGARVK